MVRAEMLYQAKNKVQLSSAWEVVKSGPEAEDSPLLQAVDRERLLRTQRAGKVLAHAVVICELRRLAVAL
jgi:hypothetical protein